VIAAGLSGPRRAYAGAARDFVLGATLLGGDGEPLRFGGQVMKNVAGFDVSRLLCGSLGILGVITQVSLKVLPQAPVEETLCLSLSHEEALAAFNRWAGQPLPLSATLWHEGRAWVRLSGSESGVKAAREKIGGERLSDAQGRHGWDRLRHCQHPLLRSEPLWRLSVPATTPPLPLPGSPLVEWGGALRWYAADLDPAAARQAAVAAGGTALCWRGPAPQGRFHPLAPALLAIHRRLKERFDPHGIFNPGRLMTELP
jgi:glycolate oxidase FAD binding subunit